MLVVKVVPATFLADTTLTAVSPSPSQTGITRPIRRGVRNHPQEFKFRLAAEACKPEVSVARLAREHGINANLQFKWRLKYQRGEFDVSGVLALRAVRTLELSEAEAAPQVPLR